ncbi:hypothetical protein [Palleronia rufa]|uniref:hypothetical protein n=1 Tax=Palleronia rufa TaxID=1530186 RepID=UPI0012683AA5|nr:hypothetical protein [Palleronia rufa]
MIVAFRRHTPLPPDDGLQALQPSVPHPTRSARHRCLQRNGISRLPDVEGEKPKRQKSKRAPIGFFDVEIVEVRSSAGKLYLFAGIDRTGRFAVTQIIETADVKAAWEFLRHMLEAVPYQIHIVLTDSGIEVAGQPGKGHDPVPGPCALTRSARPTASSTG